MAIKAGLYIIPKNLLRTGAPLFPGNHQGFNLQSSEIPRNSNARLIQATLRDGFPCVALRVVGHLREQQVVNK